MQRDPLGYVDSYDLYEAFGSNPYGYGDPLGTDDKFLGFAGFNKEDYKGHHRAARAGWRGEPIIPKVNASIWEKTLNYLGGGGYNPNIEAKKIYKKNAVLALANYANANGLSKQEARKRLKAIASFSRIFLLAFGGSVNGPSVIFSGKNVLGETATGGERVVESLGMAISGGLASSVAKKSIKRTISITNCNPLTFKQRLNIYYQKLQSAPAPKNQSEAIFLINNTLDEVEDAYSGIRKFPIPGKSESNGRMYPIQKDQIRKLRNGKMKLRTKGQQIFIDKNGTFRIKDLKNNLILEKKGGGK